MEARGSLPAESRGDLSLNHCLRSSQTRSSMSSTPVSHLFVSLEKSERPRDLLVGEVHVC